MIKFFLVESDIDTEYPNPHKMAKSIIKSWKNKSLGNILEPLIINMLVLAKKQPVSQLVPYLMVQFLAAIAAFQTYKYLIYLYF